MSADGSHVHNGGVLNVGATHAGHTRRIAVSEIQSYVARDGMGGSPRGGQGEAMDMEQEGGGGGRAGRREGGPQSGATRYGQNLGVEGEGRLPEEAVGGMGGAPVRREGGL